jgi:hypothetical protein
MVVLHDPANDEKETVDYFFSRTKDTCPREILISTDKKSNDILHCLA